MPEHPEWYSRIPDALAQLAALPANRPVTSHELSLALQTGERRAQQILKPMATVKCGRSKAAPRLTIISHLRAQSDTDSGQEALAEYSHMRAVVAKLVEEHRSTRRVLVEAPVEIQLSDLDQIDGVRLQPGRIIIEGFADGEEARRKLLALAFAIANDQTGFDQRVTRNGKHHES